MILGPVGPLGNYDRLVAQRRLSAFAIGMMIMCTFASRPVVYMHLISRAVAPTCIDYRLSDHGCLGQ